MLIIHKEETGSYRCSDQANGLTVVAVVVVHVGVVAVEVEVVRVVRVVRRRGPVVAVVAGIVDIRTVAITRR